MVEQQEKTYIERQCRTHGTYQARVLEFELFGYHKRIEGRCPSCIDEELARERRQRFEQYLQLSDIPSRFRPCRFANYQVECDGQQKALRTAKLYAERFEEMRQKSVNLLFTGLSGCGKTHLAAAIANRIMHAGHSVLYTTIPDLIEKVWAAKNGVSGERESLVYRHYIVPELLMLDEAGLQYGNETEHIMMFNVINGRYLERKPTLIISNLDAGKVQGYLGQRAMRRFQENMVQVVFKWNPWAGPTV